MNAAQDDSLDRELHVVLGAGQVGPVLARSLVARGHRVRIVSRSAAPALAGVQWVRGDASDPAFCAQVMAGARVVYHCANPMQYHRWDELLPPLARAVTHGAASAGAHLVVLDNLYMYGRPASGVIDERTPETPRSRKGELRARLATELRAAHARGDLRQLSIGRASDFFGARAARSVTFGEPFFANLARRLPSYALGDPEQPHSYAYIPDVAEGLRALGERGAGGEDTWILPHAWHGSSRELARMFGTAAGRSARLWRVPDWALRIAARFGGELSGVPEMLYQWHAPFTVDDSRFRAATGVEPTPIARAVRETLQSYGITPRAEPAALPA